MIELKDLASNCEMILDCMFSHVKFLEGFKCDHDEINDFLKNLEQSIHTQTVEIVKRLFRDINTNLLRKFNKLFKKDETGKNREWKNIEE